MMLDEEIYNAYEGIKADADAKDRMLQNIYSRTLENSAEKGKGRGRFRAKLIPRLAAVLAVVLVVPTVVYAANFFRLRDLDLGKEKVEEYTEQGEDFWFVGDNPRQEKEVDMISLAGIVDSPEYQACAEWRRFLDGYDTDKAIFFAVGNNPTGLSQEYEIAYSCYSQEMADKVDEICGKYQLSKLVGFQFAQDYSDLCRKSGAGDFCGSTSENAKLNFYGGYLYSDGTFQMEGNAIFASPELCVTDYQFMRSMKGSFNPLVLNVWAIEEYSQWNYTTKDGVDVLLANSGAKALIIVEREKSFVVVNVLGDIMSGSFQVNNEILESLADAFDFSMIY